MNFNFLEVKRDLTFKIFQHFSFDSLFFMRVSYGHLRNFWKDTNKAFGLITLNHRVFLNSESSLLGFRRAFAFLGQAFESYRRSSIFFVSGLPAYDSFISFFEFHNKMLPVLGHGFMIHWLSGLLTNMQVLLQTFFGEYNDFKYRKRVKKDWFLSIQSGLTLLKNFPDFICFFSISGIYEIAFKEAKILKIPTIAFVDSNCEVSDVTFPIISNDDSTIGLELKILIFREFLVRTLKKKLFSEIDSLSLQNVDLHQLIFGFDINASIKDVRSKYNLMYLKGNESSEKNYSQKLSESFVSRFLSPYIKYIFSKNKLYFAGYRFFVQKYLKQRTVKKNLFLKKKNNTVFSFNKNGFFLIKNGTKRILNCIFIFVRKNNSLKCFKKNYKKLFFYNFLFTFIFKQDFSLKTNYISLLLFYFSSSDAALGFLFFHLCPFFSPNCIFDFLFKNRYFYYRSLYRTCVFSFYVNAFEFIFNSSFSISKFFALINFFFSKNFYKFLNQIRMRLNPKFRNRQASKLNVKLLKKKRTNSALYNVGFNSNVAVYGLRQFLYYKIKLLKKRAAVKLSKFLLKRKFYKFKFMQRNFILLKYPFLQSFLFKYFKKRNFFQKKASKYYHLARSKRNNCYVRLWLQHFNIKRIKKRHRKRRGRRFKGGFASKLRKEFDFISRLRKEFNVKFRRARKKFKGAIEKILFWNKYRSKMSKEQKERDSARNYAKQSSAAYKALDSYLFSRQKGFSRTISKISESHRVKNSLEKFQNQRMHRYLNLKNNDRRSRNRLSFSVPFFSNVKKRRNVFSKDYSKKFNEGSGLKVFSNYATPKHRLKLASQSSKFSNVFSKNFEEPSFDELQLNNRLSKQLSFMNLPNTYRYFIRKNYVRVPRNFYLRALSLLNLKKLLFNNFPLVSSSLNKKIKAKINNKKQHFSLSLSSIFVYLERSGKRWVNFLSKLEFFFPHVSYRVFEAKKCSFFSIVALSQIFIVLRKYTKLWSGFFPFLVLHKNGGLNFLYCYFKKYNIGSIFVFIKNVIFYSITLIFRLAFDEARFFFFCFSWFSSFNFLQLDFQSIFFKRIFVYLNCFNIFFDCIPNFSLLKLSSVFQMKNGFNFLDKKMDRRMILIFLKNFIYNFKQCNILNIKKNPLYFMKVINENFHKNLKKLQNILSKSYFFFQNNKQDVAFKFLNEILSKKFMQETAGKLERTFSLFSIFAQILSLYFYILTNKHFFLNFVPVKKARKIYEQIGVKISQNNLKKKYYLKYFFFKINKKNVDKSISFHVVKKYSLSLRSNRFLRDFNLLRVSSSF